MGSTGSGLPLTEELTRRRFLRTVLGAGAGVALFSGGGLLAACGGSGGGGGTTAALPSSEAATTGSATTAAAGTPRRGGTIVYGLNTVPSGFDPQKWWNATSAQGSFSVFNRLLMNTDADGGLGPELLAEMPLVENDGTLYTFKLRPGVKFSHGRELTSDDVKFSLERLVTPATESQAATLYTGLTIPGMEDVLNERANELSGVKLIDDYMFTVELEQPDSVFLYLLSLNFMSIVPRDVVEEAGADFDFAPIGSGPFIMTNVDPANGLVLERNPNYWQPDRPYLDRVEWVIGVEPDLSVLRIQNGEQDLMGESPPQGSIDQLRNDPALEDQVVITVENNVYYITMSLKHEALQDVRVRKALGMAMDKERLVRALKGLAEPGTGGLFSPLSPYYQEGLAPAYDPEGAKALLAEAGYSDGFDVTFWTPDFTPRLELGQTAQQDLEAIGVRVDLQQTTRDAYLAAIAENPAGLVTDQWPLGYPHGSTIMDAAFTTAAVEAGCCNYSNYSNPKFDALAEEAHATSDPDELVRLYKEMDAIVVRDDALWIPMIYPQKVDFISSRLRGFSIAPWDSSQRTFADYWIEEE